MHKSILIFLLLSLLITACAPTATPAASQPSAPTISLADCLLPAVKNAQISARCGSLARPLDPASPQGQAIDIHMALIPAINHKPAADALFMLAGGPGQSAIKAYPALVLLLNRIHQDHDIVLVDQRGTGESHPLTCLSTNNVETGDEASQLALLKACPAKLDVSPKFFTTEIATQDLDAVRAALGYKTIDLYGASYGTRAALTYLRMFPKHVRTITLDAIVDPGFVLYQDSASDGQKALDILFSRCDNDKACSGAFPNLGEEFSGLLTKLDSQPANVTVPSPITAKPIDLTITRRIFTNMVYNSLYSPDLAALLPLAIHQAYTAGNYAPLVSQGYLMDAGISEGMFYAVTCTEDAPLIDAAAAQKSGQASVFGDRTLEFTQVCAGWPKGQVSAEFRSPVTSNVPALLLSGEADPITPPWHAKNAASGLSNNLSLLFPGMGHTNLTNNCTANIFKTFIDKAATSGLDTSCIAAIQPPPFFVDFNGPKP